MSSQFIFFVLCLFLFKNDAGATETHRELGAHVHGAAQVSMAFDQNDGEIDFDGAAMNIVGFEHAAVSAQDKKQLTDRLQKFTATFAAAFQFEARLNCKATAAPAVLEQNGSHSDINAHVKIHCAQSPLGSQVKVDFGPEDTHLQKVQVQVLVDSFQKSVTLEHLPGEIDLKNH